MEEFDDVTKHPTNNDSWWKRKKVVWIGTICVAVVTTIIALSVATRPREHVWKELTVEESEMDAQIVKLTGTWNDRIVVAGYKGDDTYIENYRRKGKRYERLNTFKVEGHASSMAVSDSGNIIAMAMDQPFEFLVYEREGEDWSLSGLPITLDQLNLDSEEYSHPNVMLSDKGDILGLGLQGENAGIYILERTGKGDVGGQWSLKTQPLLHTHQQDHGMFATLSAMSNDGLVLALPLIHI